jgi:hypothetical protein
MSSGDYFHRQAELCLQLAQLSEEAVASRLVQMAEDFDSRARVRGASPEYYSPGMGQPI